MAFGSAGYTDTFSGDLSSFIARKLKERFDKRKKKRKERAGRKVKAKKLLGRKKKESSDVKKVEELKKDIKPAETTSGMEDKLTPPPEQEVKKEVEDNAVQTVQGRAIFDGLVKSIEGLRAANASIRERLAKLLAEKKNQSSALAVVNKNQYEDEVIDVEFVVLEQKRLKEAGEDVTFDETGSAIVKVEPKNKKKGGILNTILGGLTKALGGLFRGVGGLMKNPIAIAGAIGGGLFLMDIFNSGAKAADGSVTLGPDQVQQLDGMFSQSGGYASRQSGSNEYDTPDDGISIDAEQEIAMAQPGQEQPAAPAAPGGTPGMNRDLAALAAISALESGSAQGQADVAQSVYNRLGDKGLYGKSIFEVVTRDAQYQPAYANPNVSSGPGTKTSKEFTGIQDEATAVKAMQSYYRKRGNNKSTEAVTQEFRSAVKNISDPTLQSNARTHVGGRTEFLGSGSRLHRLDKPHERWRGGRSDNRFFAAYGSQTQLQRGAVAPPVSLFSASGSYAPPGRVPTSAETWADKLDQSTPNIIFIPNTNVGIPIPSAGSVVRGAQEFVEDPLEALKQLRLWGGN